MPEETVKSYLATVTIENEPIVAKNFGDLVATVREDFLNDYLESCGAGDTIIDGETATIKDILGIDAVRIEVMSKDDKNEYRVRIVLLNEKVDAETYDGVFEEIRLEFADFLTQFNAKPVEKEDNVGIFYDEEGYVILKVEIIKGLTEKESSENFDKYAEAFKALEGDEPVNEENAETTA